ncbi:avidin-like [Alligator sinensis]|uniref:Avidin-like n=1 Tax=Alligator sinensis TaxID=38654 RepID=A0A1U8DQS3_ALLSI|nr:avidin-like [Alligator sinensis]
MGNSGLALLALALVTLGTTAHRKCQLSGLWQNELGSLMEIHERSKDRELTGRYLTGVTATSNCIHQVLLQGSWHGPARRVLPTFGFIVTWEKFSNSTTAFVGQCFMDESGQETLRTTWLLWEEVESPKDDWKAIRVGTNVFTRRPNPGPGHILDTMTPSCELPPSEAQ